MAILNYTITFYGKSYLTMLDLVDCFISSTADAVVTDFQAKAVGNEWTATLGYAVEQVDFLTAIVPNGNPDRISIVYPAQLELPKPIVSDFIIRINEQEVAVTTVSLFTSTETLLVRFAIGQLNAGDAVDLSFCNSQGMTAGATLQCSSFSRAVIDNQHV